MAGKPGSAERVAKLVLRSAPQVPRPGKPWLLPDCYIEMAWIPQGRFLMGSPEGEYNRLEDETQHQVTLSKGFWLGKYEITQGQWTALMGSNPSSFTYSGRAAPVENVSWDDAMEFCNTLMRKERSAGRLTAGYEYTLPTEAQWEYACRAGTAGAFHYGDNLDSDMANFDGNYPFGRGAEGVFRERTMAVGKFRQNAWGLFDMHGNVWEWCRDGYGAYPTGNVTDPAGATTVEKRVVRGGSWADDAGFCRSARRYYYEPGYSKRDLGFRLALAPVQ
ncbi:MAG: formylglycine-generating enzyme family protein [Opitutales bacterium]